MSSEASPSPKQAVPAISTRPLFGMHGERIDWVSARSQLYHLGHGARSYDPMLQCFLSKDPYSPFSVGGINPYAFCAGDPVNRTDHSGYMSTSAGLGLGLGILGIILGVISFGLAAIVTMTAIGALLLATSTVLGLASSAIGIAAAVTEDSDPELARTLGWVSLGLGIASVAVGLLGPGLATYAKATGRVLVGKLKGEGHVNYIPPRPAQGNIPASEGIDFTFFPRFRGGSFAATHGSPGFMQTINGVYVSPDMWADDLFRLPAYHAGPRGTPLHLMSCNAATPHGQISANAQYVADVLGRSVHSFNSPVTRIRTLRLPFNSSFAVTHGSDFGRLVQFMPQ